MKISIIAVGKIKENYLAAAIDEYKKRLSPWVKLETIELPEAKTGDNPKKAERQMAINDEGARLLKRLPPAIPAFLLDLHGREISSEEFAARLFSLQTAGKSHFAFVIGGPFGVSDELRARCEGISFSRLTFTHQMIRLLLIEQIYRAFKINRGEKYHW